MPYYCVNMWYVFIISVEKQENKKIENKKVEKDSKNEQEKEDSLKEENSHSSANGEVAVKGLSNLGNTCFFNAVMQVQDLLLFLERLWIGKKATKKMQNSPQEPCPQHFTVTHLECDFFNLPGMMASF